MSGSKPTRPSEVTPLVNGYKETLDDEENCSSYIPNANTNPTWTEAFAYVSPFLKPSDRRHQLLALLALSAVLLEKIVNVLPPLAIRRAVDVISDFSSGGDQDVQERVATTISLSIGSFFVLQTVDSALSALQSVTQRAVSMDAERRFATALFAHLNNLGASYHLERHSGELLRILSRGGDATSTIIEAVLFSLFPTLFEAFVVGGVFWLLGMPSIAISTILSVLLYLVYTFYVTNTRMEQRRKVLQKSEDVGRIETETLVNYETVAMFGRENREIEEYDIVRKDYTDERVNMLGLFAWLQLGQQTIRLAGICIGLWLAGRASVYGIDGDENARLSPGSFIVVQLYIQRLFNPLSVLGFIIRQITDAFTDLEKSVQMLKTEPLVKDAKDAVEWDVALQRRVQLGEQSSTASNINTTGDIEFKNVTFRYKVRSSRKKLGGPDIDNSNGYNPEKSRGKPKFGRRGLWGGKGKSVYSGSGGGRGAGFWIKSAASTGTSDVKGEGFKTEEIGGITNVSFRISAGQTVALVGASGGGKTTIVRLLLRLYDPDDGSVLVDGINVKSLFQQSLRSNIGVVAQDTVLFHASLRDNICYGKEDATEEDVWEAIRLSALDQLVNSLPEKLDTIVGERGMKLSGGERQRVGLARCIIKKPKLIILDEATAHLDSTTEKKIQRNILTPRTSAICKGRTTLMIAHRLSTARQSDVIIVLDKGMVVEQGTHDELLALGTETGMYAKMWKDQMEGDCLDELK
jgi:ABC-type multidrug transport system fused ATPase/permease subunit